MDKTAYFKLPGISNSALGNFKQSPMHYKYCLEHPRADTKATLIGSAFHYMCFEPGMVHTYMKVLHEHERPVPLKDYRNSENKAWKDSIINECSTKGLELISSDDFGVAEDMYDAVEKTPEAIELLRAGGNHHERMDTWTWDGVLFKRKTDVYNEFFQADLKSCECADPAVFARQIFSWDYHRQGGMYSDGDRVINDTEFFNPFYLIAVEKTPPYGVSVHLLTDEVLAYGCAEYRKLAQELEACRKANNWPGYNYKYNKVNNIYLPKYLNND